MPTNSWFRHLVNFGIVCLPSEFCQSLKQSRDYPSGKNTCKLKVRKRIMFSYAQGLAAFLRFSANLVKKLTIKVAFREY